MADKMRATPSTWIPSKDDIKEALQRSEGYSSQAMSFHNWRTLRRAAELYMNEQFMVDACKNFLHGELDEMIAVWLNPIEEAEQREKDRVAAIQARIDIVKNPILHDEFGLPLNSVGLAVSLKLVQDFVIDVSFAEFMAAATQAKDATIANLESIIAAAQKQESEAAELERLRQENAEREQKERDERIAAEATAKAEKDKAEAELRAAPEAVKQEHNEYCEETEDGK